ncbi:MAG: glycine--tRNA ligase subunit beta [Idiomarina sp.]|nr:glycine--tRNA ligase subunit beta [Idiomarina sp.]
MITKDLLIELGTEELPPKSLQALAQSFALSIETQLKESELVFTSAKSPNSPRRLAVIITDLQSEQADKIVEKRGPAVSAAFAEDGTPTKAALGWARGNGIEIDQAERLVTDKGEWLLHKAVEKGQPVTSLLQAFIEKALKQLPIPRPMRWGTTNHSFIRPVHQVTVLFGEDVVDLSVLGIKSSNKVTGHRFHHPELLTIQSAGSYIEQMADAHVLVDFEQRKAVIREQIEELADQEHANPVMDEDLLDEVASLVEWPVAHVAGFAESFLQVPKEALIYTMKDDQRYFPLESKQGDLLPRFIFISNIESKDPRQVIEGNEKVVRPRLADAQFFFTTDQKTKLVDRVAKLNTVLFQKQLGTLGEKAERISLLSQQIASDLNDDAKAAARAGLLAKADLMSDMVMEFPEVQGIMGMHYARLDGESELVATAIEAHYHPRFAGDTLPDSKVGCAVALADKLDTLVGIFGIGQTPKGDRDPFALRRAAIGMLRILVEKQLPLDLNELVHNAAVGYGDKIEHSDTLIKQVVDFLLGRFRAYYEEQGIRVDVIQAVLARRPTVAYDFDRRIQAVNQFRDNAEAEALAAANKRVGNILAKAEAVAPEVNPQLLTEAAEIELYQALQGVKGEVSSSLDSGDYDAALSHLAGLRQPVDSFFDNVMVNADDDAVRQNRLALLQDLRAQFLDIADISLLQS